MAVNTDATNHVQLQLESKEVWYLDGSVVLRTGNTLYCVYSGILSQWSDVFKDMFSSAQPDLKDVYQGRPVVEVFDDPEDLVHFLKAIHDHRYFETDVLPVVAHMVAVLKVATKYEVQYLRSAILQRLVERHCVTTLSLFDDLCDSGFQATTLKDFILIANNARQCGAQVLLPSALLMCCEISYENLIHCDLASSCNLFKAFLPTVKQLTDCLTSAECRITFAECASTFDAALSIIPFISFSSFCEVFQSRLCLPCFRAWKDSHAEGRQELWDSLPSFFGLPTWQEFKQQSGCTF
ncbi:hypothetical protein BC835DRAFT_295567 [Cytidiella melzeri]|nr:hypothetical protein BC835DRAFT_295567 [Cytidiella melzeri]